MTKFTFPNGTVTDLGSGVVQVVIPAAGTLNSPGLFGITIEGGGNPILTGIKGDIQIPSAGWITGWTILADQTGSCVIDLWKTTYSGYPPTVSNTITGSALPTLTSANKATSTTLTGWTTSITANDIIRFNVNSASVVTRVTLLVNYTKVG